MFDFVSIALTFTEDDKIVEYYLMIKYAQDETC